MKLSRTRIGKGFQVAHDSLPAAKSKRKRVSSNNGTGEKRMNFETWIPPFPIILPEASLQNTCEKEYHISTTTNIANHHDMARLRTQHESNRMPSKIKKRAREREPTVIIQAKRRKFGFGRKSFVPPVVVNERTRIFKLYEFQTTVDTPKRFYRPKLYQMYQDMSEPEDYSIDTIESDPTCTEPSRSSHGGPTEVFSPKIPDGIPFLVREKARKVSKFLPAVIASGGRDKLYPVSRLYARRYYKFSSKQSLEAPV
eukprot:208486_1